MRVLLALTYYRPHVSGLTLSVARLAEGLAARGHDVTVLTSRHLEDLPTEESVAGVRVVRVPVTAVVGKGPLMPAHASTARGLLGQADVVLVNLPATPPEALLLPRAARRRGLPVVATYHCELQLPAGLLNRMVDRSVLAASRSAVANADRVVALSEDYAAASRALEKVHEKLVIIPPPAALGRPDPEGAMAWRVAHAGEARVLIGFFGRLAAEKGVDVLLRALPAVEAELGPTRLLLVGESARVLGEDAYRARLTPLLEAAGERVRVLGVVRDSSLPGLYAACDVTVLPSLNSTESFGLVQVESMLAGTPVIASDLPGVRVPVRTTGMGLLVPPGDASALAAAIVAVVRERERYLRPREDVERHFSVERTVTAYEALLSELVAARQ